MFAFSIELGLIKDIEEEYMELVVAGKEHKNPIKVQFYIVAKHH